MVLVFLLFVAVINLSIYSFLNSNFCFKYYFNISKLAIATGCSGYRITACTCANMHELAVCVFQAIICSLAP